MSIEKITTNDLRKMKDKEGLILQGCGGDLNEWVDGINELFAENNILLNGSKFNKVYTFNNDECTNLMFPFENVELDMGKLAMWRLGTHSQFYGTWLSDYVENQCGGYIQEQKQIQKPDCELIGKDGNIFHLMGLASRTLRMNGLEEKSSEMCERVKHSGSYDEALCIIGDYVNITGPEDNEDINMKDEGMVM